MKPGDKVVVRRSQQQVEVHEVDGAHVTVRWLGVSGNTESRTYPENELELYVPEPVAVLPGKDTPPLEVKLDEPAKPKKSKK